MINQIMMKTLNVYVLSSSIIRKEIKKEKNTFHLQTFPEDTYLSSNYSLIEYVQNETLKLYQEASSLLTP